jgi:two-component system sensor histidine kinase KdpD
VMALVDECPECRRGLRRAASLAGVLHAPWVAVALETPAVQQSRDRRLNLQANLDYAADLGAEIVRGEASDTARALAELIAERRVSHLILVLRRHRGFSLGRRPLADRLLDEVPGLEIHLVGA